MSGAGRRLVDVSFLSGADVDQDGRVFARADLDRDGAEDIVLVSRNAPVLRIFRNRIAGASGHHWLGLRLRGDGARTNADAIGATVEVRCGGRTIRRDVSGGEGFSAHNARALTIGVGTCRTADVAVRFAPDLEQRFEQVAVDRWYTLEQGGDLVVASRVARIESKPEPATDGAQLLDIIGADADLAYLTLWATWCASCKSAQPRLDAIATEVAESIEVIGLSMDPADDSAAVESYEQTYQPAYRLLALPKEAHADAIAAVETLFGEHPPLPSGVLLDRTGAVLWKGVGVITRSDLAKAIDARQKSTPTRWWWFALAGLLVIALLGWRRATS